MVLHFLVAYIIICNVYIYITLIGGTYTLSDLSDEGPSEESEPAEPIVDRRSLSLGTVAALLGPRGGPSSAPRGS